MSVIYCTKVIQKHKQWAVYLDSAIYSAIQNTSIEMFGKWLKSFLKAVDQARDQGKGKSELVLNVLRYMEIHTLENIKLEQFYEMAEGNASEREMIREIYDTICDVVCFPRKQITIKGTSYPWQVVKSQFLKLKPVHIANLLERLVDNSLEIKNMESYLISTLYAESLSGTLKEQADLHDDYLRYLRGNPYKNIQ